MVTYKAIFFWLGGVLTDPIEEVTLDALAPKAVLKVSHATKLKLRQLAEQLSLGRISPSDYCQRALQMSKLKLDAGELEGRIIEKVALRPPVMDLLAAIPPTYERWLLSQYPMQWFSTFSRRMALSDHFPHERTMYISEIGLERIVPDLFSALPKIADCTVNECLMIDGMSARAVAAVRHGLASIIYIYPERLKHELALQGILKTASEVLHPHASERVNI